MADGAIESVGAEKTYGTSGSSFNFSLNRPLKEKDPKEIDIGNFLNGTKATGCYG